MDRGAAPDPGPDGEMALRVWNFCGGWDPVRIPYAAAFYAAQDLDLLVELLMVIRRRLDERDEAQRAANGR